MSAALNQLNRALNQGNQATSFSISANTQSLMVGPAAAFGDYGSVVTIDLSKHPLEEMELVGLVKDCLLNFCSGEITTKLFETLHIVPSSSETPVAYRFVSSGLQFPTIIDLLVRPRAAGGDK